MPDILLIKPQGTTLISQRVPPACTGQLCTSATGAEASTFLQSFSCNLESQQDNTNQNFSLLGQPVCKWSRRSRSEEAGKESHHTLSAGLGHQVLGLAPHRAVLVPPGSLTWALLACLLLTTYWAVVTWTQCPPASNSAKWKRGSPPSIK